MRNLKKVLSLTLAFVMLLGMMVVGAGAATDDLVDFDAVAEDNQEAVAVMNAVNVFIGNDKGEFNPDGKLTRAAAAKIVLSMVQGPTTVDALLKNTTSTLFDDMGAANVNWAAGIVDVCANLGIIKGVADRKFNPNGEVTNVQFAAMVARAVDPEGDYNNADTWETNVRLFAAKSGLAESASITDWKAPMTRAQACQVSFNGIQYSPNGSSWKVGEVEFDNLKDATMYAAIVGGTPVPVLGTDSLATTVFKLKQDETDNGLGQKVKTWAIGDEEPFYIGEKLETPVVTYTQGGVDEAKVKKDTGAASANVADDKILINGTAKGTAAGNTDVSTLCENGKTVEVYVDSSKVITKVVMIAPTVATVSADPTTRTSNDTEQVRIPGVVSSWTATSKVSGWEELAKGDVVLWVEDANDDIVIEKAESVSGTVTSVKDGLPGIDGTYYKNSALTGASNSWSDDYTNTYTFYLDNSGCVVKAVKETDEAAESDYVFVLQTAWVTGSGAIGDSKYAQAQIVNTKAEAEVVTVSKVGGKTIIEPGTAIGSGDANYDSEIRFSDSGDPTGHPAITVGNWYKGSNVNGKYELTAVANVEVIASSTTITKGNAKFDGTHTANANTLFVYATGSGSDVKYAAYTGIASIPGVTLENGKKIEIVNNSGSVAEVVYVDATGNSTLTGVAGDIIYVHDKSKAEGKVVDGKLAYYEIPAIVNGADDTLKLATDQLASLTNKTLYETTKNDDGVVTGLTAKTWKTGVAISGHVVTMGGDVVEALNDTCEIYYIDAEGSVRAMDWDSDFAQDATDKGVVIANGESKIVYIMQVVGDATTATVKSKVGEATAEVVAWSENATTHVMEGTLRTAIGNTVTLEVSGLAEGATATTVTPITAAATDKKLSVTVTAEDGTHKTVYELTVTGLPAAGTIGNIAYDDNKNAIQAAGDDASANPAVKASIEITHVAENATVAVTFKDSQGNVVTSVSATGDGKNTTADATMTLELTSTSVTAIDGGVKVTVTVTPDAADNEHVAATKELTVQVDKKAGT